MSKAISVMKIESIFMKFFIVRVKPAYLKHCLLRQSNFCKIEVYGNLIMVIQIRLIFYYKKYVFLSLNTCLEAKSSFWVIGYAPEVLLFIKLIWVIKFRYWMS